MSKKYQNQLTAFNALTEALEQIPTIGKKSAIKMAYSLSVEDKFLGVKLAHCLENAIQKIHFCQLCGGLSENEICEICIDDERDTSQLCIILHPRDIFTIEESNGYNGRYFVLPASLEELDIHLLGQIITQNQVQEIIFAFSPTLANEAIMLFVEDKLQDFNLTFSKIAQGVPTGIGLDHVDSLSLSKAISQRNKI